MYILRIAVCVAILGFATCVRGQVCNVNPCKNGATCLDFGLVQQCNCTLNYWGDTCEDEKPCFNQECQNNGTCNKDLFCNCPFLYEGDNCQYLSLCKLYEPCQNGGSCTDIDRYTGYNCTCPKGFLGKQCEYGDINLDGCGVITLNSSSDTLPWNGFVELIDSPVTFDVTLISDQWAVASASVFDYIATPATVKRVTFGGAAAPQVTKIRRVVPFPGYNPPNRYGDIALIEFVDKLTFGPFVTPACVSYYPEEYVADSSCLANTNTPSTGSLNSVTPSYGQICRDSIDDGEDFNTDSMFCYNLDPSKLWGIQASPPLSCKNSVDGLYDIAGVGVVPTQGVNNNDTFVLTDVTTFAPFILGVLESDTLYLISDYLGVNPTAQCTLPYTFTFPILDVDVVHSLDYASSRCVDEDRASDVLCSLFLPIFDHLRSTLTPNTTYCRDYCESVLGDCGDAVEGDCSHLLYGATQDQQWCNDGEDESCGQTDLFLFGEYDFTGIESPFFPANYQTFRHCRWYVTCPVGYVVRVKFSALDIATGDALSIGNGGEVTAAFVVRGSVAPPVWRSRGIAAWLRFDSNAVDSEFGFSLWVISSKDEVRDCTADEFECGEECYPNEYRCDFITDCSTGIDEYECNEFAIPVGEVIQLRSPFYPNRYSTDLIYTWFLTSGEGGYIALEFVEFFVSSDWVMIGDGQNASSGSLVAWSGSGQGPRKLPTSRSVWVQLVSDEADTDFGFVMDVTSIPAEKQDEYECVYETEFDCGDGVCLPLSGLCDGYWHCTNGADEERCPVSFCDNGTVIPDRESCSDDGAWFCGKGEDERNCRYPIASTEYFVYVPAGYRPNQRRYWSFEAQVGFNFDVSFSGTFGLEADYDLLEMGFGTSLGRRGLRIYTGDERPAPFLIKYRSMWISFRSDSSKSSEGFSMTVGVIREEDVLFCEKDEFIHRNLICDGLYHCQDGQDEIDCDDLERSEVINVLTPGVPNTYEDNLRLVWAVTAASDLRLLLEFTVFFTEEDYDIMYVFPDPGNWRSAPIQLSGLQLPRPILSADNRMNLTFVSDYYLSFAGIRAVLSAVDSSTADYSTCPDGVIIREDQKCNFYWDCDDGDDEIGCDPLYPFNETVEFASVMHPLPYPRGRDTVFSVNLTTEANVTVSFDRFDLNEGDFLAIGCGYAINRICPLERLSSPLESLVVPLTCDDAIFFTFRHAGDGLNTGYRGRLSFTPPAYPSCDPSIQQPLCGSDNRTYENMCTLDAEICKDNSVELAYIGRCVGCPDGAPVIPCLIDTCATATCPADPYAECRINYCTPGSPCLVEWFNQRNPAMCDHSCTAFGCFEYDPSRTCQCDRLCYGAGNCCEDYVDAGCNTCEEFTCGEFNENQICQCDPGCVLTDDCCSDYIDVCDSCADGCFDFDPLRTCQCDRLCFGAGNCCHDYVDEECNTCAEFTCGAFHKKQVCQCDTACAENNTCCSDYEEVCVMTTMLMMTTQIDETFTTIPPLLDTCAELTCVAAYNENQTCQCDPECAVNDDCCSDYEEVCVSVGPVPLIVTSPGYPDLYPEDADVTTTYVAPEDHVILLNITSFDMELNFDYLSIGDGSASGEYLAKLTGRNAELPFILLSPGRFLSLHFTSDSLISGSGYIGTVTAIPEDDVCDNVIIPPAELCNNQWFCSEGDDELGCPYVPPGDRGVITSPGYPENYESNEDVVWTFRYHSQPGSIVIVNIIDFDTEEGYDFLIIGFGLDPGNGTTVLHILSGPYDNLPFQWFSLPGSDFWIRFTSDSSSNGKGFSLSVVELFICDDGTSIPIKQRCDHYVDCPYGPEDETNCVPLAIGTTVYFTSSNYPGRYPPDIEDQWIFGSVENSSMAVTIEEFDTEETYDFLRIVSAAYPSKRPIVKILEGTIGEQSFTVESNNMWMYFESDDINEGTGFKGHVVVKGAVDPTTTTTLD